MKQVIEKYRVTDDFKDLVKILEDKAKIGWTVQSIASIGFNILIVYNVAE